MGWVNPPVGLGWVKEIGPMHNDGLIQSYFRNGGHLKSIYELQ